jgi:proteasome lid subunit RPN8/RPN11
LIGTKKVNDYIIKEIKIPEIIAQDFSSVTAKPCSSDAILSLHSHPYKSCYFSVHDINTYEIVKEINKDAIMGVMCEADRFNFYGLDEFI